VYERGLHLANELWARPDADLRSALNVSFLEHLDFRWVARGGRLGAIDFPATAWLAVNEIAR
jgi:hypothetical protein